jgi:hypothetical protein
MSAVRLLECSCGRRFMTWEGVAACQRQHFRESEEEALAYVGTCQSCGRYLDVRQHKRCPSPCDGYIG